MIKANRLKRIRRKYKNKRWIAKQLIKQIEYERYLMFDFLASCSKFFRQDHIALANQKTYTRGIRKSRVKQVLYKKLYQSKCLNVYKNHKWNKRLELKNVK